MSPSPTSTKFAAGPRGMKLSCAATRRIGLGLGVGIGRGIGVIFRGIRLIMVSVENIIRRNVDKSGILFLTLFRQKLNAVRIDFKCFGAATKRCHDIFGTESDEFSH